MKTRSFFKNEGNIEDSNTEIEEMSHVDTLLPSKSTGLKDGSLALRIQIPQASNIRYKEGAPVVILGEGGYVSDGIVNKKVPNLDDMLIITFIYPGGENKKENLHSDGDYDYRGIRSIQALRDVILYAAGEITDNKGKTIDQYMSFNVLHDNIGFIGFSFGGNIGVAAAALEGSKISDKLKYIIQWETPVSSQIATRDLGKMLLKPISEGPSAQGNYFNPRYISYGPLVINMDYSDIAYDPKSLYKVFLDGNGDGKFTTIEGSYYNYPTPDLNDNNTLESTEDYGLDTYPYSSFDLDGKIVYSRPATIAIKKNNIFDNNWPKGIATLEEAKRYWDMRESVSLYPKALENIPSLEAMFLLSAEDHVQSDPYKSHAHQAFDGWTDNGGWIKINPSIKYLIEVNPDLGDNNFFIPDIEPNQAPRNWEDIKSYCIPEIISDETYQIAAIHQMADRAMSK